MMLQVPGMATHTHTHSCLHKQLPVWRQGAGPENISKLLPFGGNVSGKAQASGGATVFPVFPTC